MTTECWGSMFGSTCLWRLPAVDGGSLACDEPYFGQSISSALRGSKDPNSDGLGPRYHSDYNIRVLMAHYLGPWTLMVDC